MRRTVKRIDCADSLRRASSLRSDVTLGSSNGLAWPSAAAETTRRSGAVSRRLPLPEKLGVAHDRLLGMHAAHVFRIGFVVGHADHQSRAVADALAEDGKRVSEVRRCSLFIRFTPPGPRPADRSSLPAAHAPSSRSRARRLCRREHRSRSCSRRAARR